MKPQDEEARKELEGLSPLLARLRKKQQDPQAPEGYFERLPMQVMSRIALQDVKPEEKEKALEIVVRSWQSRWLGWGMAAAAVMVLFVFGWLLFFQTNPDTEGYAQTQGAAVESAETVAVSEMETFALDNIEEDLLVEVLLAEEATTPAVEVTQTPATQAAPTQEEMEEYLLEDEDDFLIEYSL